MQRMHGGCFWIRCEIESRASEVARIMMEWSYINEGSGWNVGGRRRGKIEGQKGSEEIFGDLMG